MLLPQKVGPFTLMRRLSSDGVTDGYVAILDEPAGKQVAARRALPYVLSDPRRSAELEARVKDLQAVRHPVLVPVIDYVSVGDDRYIIDEWVDAIDLERVINWCRQNREALPHNVYLNLATQICNGLEALHSRPGAETGVEHVLHMALQPNAIFITGDGRVIVGNYGLARSPTATPHSGSSTSSKMEYLSPEQTHQDQQLAPSSDIFSLGSILYEMLTLKAMFKADSNLQTIHKVRRAEVTTQLLEVKEILPGLDKVLYRALSLNPRHRYQRAFVLREDLRGLMAGYSFANIADNTRDFLQPLFQARSDHSTDEVMPGMTGDDTQPETTAALLGTDGPLAEESQTTTNIKINKPHEAPAPAAFGGGLPVAVGTEKEPPPQDTAAMIRAAQSDLGGDETRPENQIIQPARELKPMATPPPATPPRPEGFGDDDDDSPTDVRPAPDETSWVAKLPTGGARDPYDPPTLPPFEQLTPLPARPLNVPAPVAEEGPTQPDDSQLAPVDKKLALPPGDFHQPQNVGTPAPAAEVTYAPDIPVAVYSDDFDDLDYKPGQTNYLPYIVAGVGVAAVVLALFVCVGGGGLGALIAGRPQTATATSPTATGPVVAATPAAKPKPEDGPTEDREVAAADVATQPRPQRLTDPKPSRAQPSPAPTYTAAAAPVRPAPTRPAPAAPPPPQPEPEPAYVPDPEPSYTADPQPAYAVDDFAVDDDTPIAGSDLGDLAGYADRSFRGELTEADRQTLAQVTASDPNYTRTYTLLYQDARARGDLDDRKVYLTAIMAQPENEYRPEFLVEEAELAIRGQDYNKALKKAQLAERHWQRLPSDMIFTRKAMMFEIEAAAQTGLFFKSDGQQMDALADAIRGWEKYRRHVESKERDDLIARADLQLNKLLDMQRRLE